MNVLDILKYGNRTLVGSIDRLPEGKWEVGGVCGYWSAKDVMAHLAAYERLLEEVLDTFLGTDPGPTMAGMAESGPEFNDAEVGRRQSMSVAEILSEYNEAHGRVLAKAAEIPVDTYRETGTMPWYGLEYCLEDFIVYSSYGHKREHSAQIDVCSDSLT
jgi:hypothetical protein